MFACYFPSWKSLCQLAPFPFSDLFLFCFPPLEGLPCHSHRAVPFSFQWHCTIAAPRQNAGPCHGVLALCSWTLLTVSISRGPSPEKISGSSWTFPLSRNPHVVGDKHGIWNRAGGKGILGFSCHPHHCVEPVVSVDAVCDTFPRLPTLPQCSCAQQHGAAWWLMKPLSDVVAPECHRIVAPLLPEAREVQLASGAVAPSVHPPYSSHESFFVTCS